MKDPLMVMNGWMDIMTRLSTPARVSFLVVDDNSRLVPVLGRFHPEFRYFCLYHWMAPFTDLRQSDVLFLIVERLGPFVSWRRSSVFKHTVNYFMMPF